MPIAFGSYSYARQLECQNLRCDTIQVGDHDSKNHVSKGTVGSILFFQYGVFFQVGILQTTAGSTSIRLTRTAGVALTAGDTVYFESLDVDAVGAIPAASLLGPRVVTAVANANSTFDINVGVSSTQTTTYTIALACRVDIYRYLDLAGSSSDWQRSTTLPTTSYENVASS